MRRVLDLFCGAGGFSLGFKLAGFKVYGIESLPKICETYEKNVGKVMCANIKEIDWQDILSYFPEPDIIIGGPPCEGYTVANPKRKKNPLDRLYKDERGNLVMHFIRILSYFKPKVFVMENVAGIMEGKLKEALEWEFKKVGYDKIYFNVLYAEDYGVPSHRKRVFISNLKFNLKKEKRVTVWEAIGDLPDPYDIHNIKNHTPVPIPKRIKKKISFLKWGEAAVYFKGHNILGRNYERLYPNKIAPTIKGLSRFVHPYEDRILTVRENARLMSFPDWFEFLGGRDLQFDQVGEAVPPKLAFKIAEFIRQM